MMAPAVVTYTSFNDSRSGAAAITQKYNSSSGDLGPPAMQHSSVTISTS